jgi:hypothetical protein
MFQKAQIMRSYTHAYSIGKNNCADYGEKTQKTGCIPEQNMATKPLPPPLRLIPKATHNVIVHDAGCL